MMPNIKDNLLSAPTSLLGSALLSMVESSMFGKQQRALFDTKSLRLMTQHKVNGVSIPGRLFKLYFMSSPNLYFL